MVSKPVLTRFPFINLAKSLERARAIYENDKSGKGLRMPVAFSAWGYSDKSSGGFQTVAALKSYGLLEDEGANDDRSVKLTGDARQYFQTEIEDDHNRLHAKFAGRPPLMAHLLEHWDRGTVADPVARTYLKTEIGLNEQSTRSALGIYKDNLSFIGRKGQSSDSGDIEENDADDDYESVLFGGARIGDLIDWEVDGVICNPAPMRVVGLSDDKAWAFVNESRSGLPMGQVIVREQAAITPPISPAVTAPLNPFAAAQQEQGVMEAPIPESYRSERFDADEGVITISWPANLSTQSVEDMKAWVELLMKRIERRARANEGEK